MGAPHRGRLRQTRCLLTLAMCDVISDQSPQRLRSRIHACMGGHTLAILNLLRKAVERLVLELTNVLPFLDLHACDICDGDMGSQVLREDTFVNPEGGRA